MTVAPRIVCWFSVKAQCPLYIESHVGNGLGCVDDLARPCLVERGEISYHEALRAIIDRRMRPN